MPDETATILAILQSIGVYDWLTAKVKSEAELIDMFQNDFGGLMQLCMK
jgi:hypothetical protein